MKRIIYFFVLLLVIGTILFFAIKASNSLGNEITVTQNKPENIVWTENITTVMTLEDTITADTVWCGTFQLIWNDLKNELAMQDIVFSPQLEVAENLNKETFKEENISEESYYKVYGHPTLELKQTIEKALKEKFNENSEILDEFDFENAGPNDYFLYAMLKKEFEFKYAFDKLDKGSFNNITDVQFFGIDRNSKDELKTQITVLYYIDKEQFAIKIDTKEKDDIIIVKSPEGETFNEILNNVSEKSGSYSSGYTGNKKLKKDELVKIPNITFKQKVSFDEITNKKFSFKDGRTYYISKAMQTIEFDLNNKGGKIKSEAGMMTTKTSAIVEDKYKIREFIVDNTFAIFLIEEDSKVPYFAAKIDDISKFQ